VIEGPKLLREAVAAGASIDTVFVEAGGQQALATIYGPVVEVQEGTLARACDAQTSQGIAAIVEMLDVPISALSGPDLPLAVICVDLQDPGNAGTVLRGAAASGAGAVVFTGGAVDVYNPKAVRASAGAVFHVPVSVAPVPEDALDQMARWRLRRIATDAHAGREYTECHLSDPVALVLGSESHGLPAHLASKVDETVTIPMQRGIESLNVAMAANILCFEAARQRRMAS
jgi:TrmH family RNA methyltransferase